MRVPILLTYCDICNGERSEKVEADESDSILFTSQGGQPLRLDVCTDHKNPSWSDIKAYALPDMEAEPPRKRRPPKIAMPIVRDKRTRKFVCEVCGDMRDTEQGTRMHKIRSGHR